ncbi:Polyprotein [Phytophthora palmivora]|uniref:Polyprotein n=1 Tax=Phytophthora palmivora TaxID=4796 RepID=A0A2P4YU46_9STRA|nr:Polyprotein [Phytophthora palmivora]
MARWLSFFAEYNFRIEYKPGKHNVLADALSRRPDYELAHVSRVTTDLYDRIRLAYQGDENYTPLLAELADGLLRCRVDPGDPPRVVVPNDEDLKVFLYQQIAGIDESRLRFGLPVDDKGNAAILVFVCCLSKMVHLAPVRDKAGKQVAQLFLDSVFRYHGLPETDRDPRFTGAFWGTLFQLLGTKLTMSTADHPQTAGQTERVNCELEDTLRSICAEAPRSWSDQLPMVEFTLNNAVHASPGWNSAVNAPMDLVSLTTKSIQISTKDLKGPRLASLRGSLTTGSKPKGYRVHAISKLTDLVV